MNETTEKRPLRSLRLSGPISALHSGFNPRNILDIPVVKTLMRLDLEPN